MTSNTLLHPSQLTPELFEALLKQLQDACQRFNATSQPERSLMLRDFWFLVEDGQPMLDLFVEPAPGHQGDSPFPPPEQAVTLDECLPLHQFLLEDGCLDAFNDDVGVRVGSLGMEPPLRTLEHFASAKGQVVTLKTWTKRQGRDRFTVYLDDVIADATSPSLRLKDGTEVFEIPLSAVKFAQALLSQPKSAKANAQKAPKESKRARGKA
ncbi:MAG: hypothetical protein RI932_1792 [Pseudomonadota bacterium]|jgi:ribosome maturation factor RimP